MFILETHEGGPYERGLDHGRKFRHVIQGNIHTWCFYQPEQASEAEMEEIIAPLRPILQKWSPETYEEMRGIAEGSQVEFVWIERMQLRVWNRLRSKAAAAAARGPQQPAARAPAPSSAPAPITISGPGSGCTGIGMITRDKGAVLGGTLDDPRQCFVMSRNRPRGRRAYVQTRWAGATWGHNGVNESGLALVQQSMGGFDKPVPIDAEATALYSIVSAQVLQQCDTVVQSLELLKAWPDQESLLLADRTGDLAAVCVWGRRQFVQRPGAERMVWNSNQVHIPEAVAFAAEHGAKPNSSPYTRTRHEFLSRFARERGGDFKAADLEGLLRSLCGHPHSVCNDGTVNATMALPQAEPAVMYVADRPPSRNPFVRYEVG